MITKPPSVKVPDSATFCEMVMWRFQGEGEDHDTKVEDYVWNVDAEEVVKGVDAVPMWYHDVPVRVDEVG